ERGGDVEWEVRGGKKKRKAPTTNRAGQRPPGRRKGGKVDGDGVTHGVGDQLQAHVQVEDLTLVHEPLSAQHGADDVHRLAQPADAALEPDAVPALDYLVARRPQPQHNAAATDAVQRGGALCDQCWAATEDVDDAGPKLDPIRTGGDVGQDGEGVPAVRLRDPDSVVTQAIGRLDKRAGGLARHMVRVWDPESQFHNGQFRLSILSG